MKTMMPVPPDDEIVELRQQIELKESNYKFAVELQRDPHALIKMKEEIRHLKERLETLLSSTQKNNRLANG